jgi:hypothetical protein
MRSLRLFPASIVAAALFATAAPLFAQVQDSAPVDVSALLKELHRLRDTQTVQSKQQRQAALQQINSAASSPERAVAMWEEAVRVVQFQGAAKENAAFRDWKEKDGEALSGPLARNAARLYFVWLGLTIQRDGDVKVKDLLPQIMAYTKELVADELGAEALDDAIKREREMTVGKRPIQQRKASDADVRKMHDHILRRGLASSPVVQWLKLADFVNPEKWENQPGDLDGIYTKIVLPELRAQHDARALEYWDFKLKQEGEAAVKTKLAFDLDKFNTQRRPALLWSRAEEMLAIGQKNRAIGEMFGIIKANPQNPSVPAWIAQVEAVLVPPPPATEATVPGSASGLPGSSAAPLPGSEPGVVK